MRVVLSNATDPSQAAQPLKKAVAALDEATQRLAAILVERAVSGR